MRNICTILLGLMSLASCCIKQDLQFNKDWSGGISWELDLSELYLLKVSDSVPGRMLDENDAATITNKLKAIPGITDVKSRDHGKGIYTLRYHFHDISALNQSSAALFSDDETHSDFVYFQLRDPKSLYFTLPVTDPLSNNGNYTVDKDAMNESFKYSLTLSFPRKIKTFETKSGAVLSKNKKQITYNTSIQTMSEPDYAPGMLIVLQ